MLVNRVYLTLPTDRTASDFKILHFNILKYEMYTMNMTDKESGQNMQFLR